MLYPRPKEAAMYRSLLLVVLALSMTGCAVYDYDPGYSHGYYESYRVQTYPQSYYYYQEPRRYPAYRYYQAPPARHYHGRSEYRPPVRHEAPRMQQPARSHQGPRLQAPRHDRYEGHRSSDRRAAPGQQQHGGDRRSRHGGQGGYRPQQGQGQAGSNHGPGGRH
jgi:hypothetical protein